MTQEKRASRQLAPEAASARAARRFVRDTLTAWGQDALIDITVLLTSELVTNAILHAHTGIQLSILAEDEGLHIEVFDANGQLPVRKSYPDDAVTGRGLALIEHLSAGWGIDAMDGGKVVWFEVAAPSSETTIQHERSA